MHPTGWLLRACLPLAVALPVGLLAPPTAAHPFGDPQTVELERTEDGVSVRWRAAEDDLTALALRLDAVEGPRAYVLRDGAMVPEVSESDDVAALAESPRLPDYLLATITVRHAGVPCEGSLADSSDLAGAGALLEFRCPAPTEEVELTVRTLTDLHGAYRTAATGPGGTSHMFSTQADTHVFPVDGAGAGHTPVRGAVTMLGWAGGALLLGLGMTRAVRRRRQAVA